MLAVIALPPILCLLETTTDILFYSIQSFYAYTIRYVMNNKNIFILLCYLLLGIASPCLAFAATPLDVQPWVEQDAALNQEQLIVYKEMGLNLRPQPEFEGLTTKTVLGNFKNIFFSLQVLGYYPQNTGNQAVDSALKSFVTEKVTAYLQEYYDDFTSAQKHEQQLKDCVKIIPTTDPELCNDSNQTAVAPATDWLAQITYEISQPTPTYISTIFCFYDYLGGAHDNWTYTVLSFNLQTGAPLTLQDLFPEPERSLPLLMAAVNKSVEDIRQASYPSNADNQTDNTPFSQDYSQLTPEVIPPETMEQLLRELIDKTALTANGITLYYAPYEQGSFSEGDFILSFTKEFLVSIGANKKIWQ